MNIEEYIASGLLEAYILGSLTSTEHVRVAADIAANPELAAYVADMEATFQQYAISFAKQPPVELENKIWSKLETLNKHGHTPNAGIPTQQKTKNIAIEPAFRKAAQWKYAATLVALIGSLGANMLLWNESKRTQSEQSALAKQMEDMRLDHERLVLALNDYQKAKNMMADTAMQTIVMHTVVSGHPMAATIYWNKNDGAAYVAMNALPTPPSGMQYQLWAIKSGKPIDMGMLPNDMANSPTLKKIAMAVTASEAFAISLEKEGGNPTPTLVYVLGKAS